jgi:hypothetical protein
MKNLKRIQLSACGLFIGFSIYAQGPPNPPLDPGLGGGPVGGGAPLSDGTALLLLAAAVWAGSKLCRQLWKLKPDDSEAAVD